MTDAEHMLVRAQSVRRRLIHEGYKTVHAKGHRIEREQFGRGWLMTIHALDHYDDCATCLAVWRANMSDADSQLLCAFPHHDWNNPDE